MSPPAPPLKSEGVRTPMFLEKDVTYLIKSLKTSTQFCSLEEMIY